jgi:hypothetical protein
MWPKVSLASLLIVAIAVALFAVSIAMQQQVAH